MGEMAAVFNDLKQATKDRRDKRAIVNIADLEKLGIPAREQSKNVFRIETDNGAVMYYPPSNMWQHKGRVHRGDVYKLHAWLHTQGYL